MYRYRCIDLERYHIIHNITDRSYHKGLFPQQSPVGSQLSTPLFWQQSTQTDTHNTQAHKLSQLHTLALSTKKHLISLFLSPSHFLSLHDTTCNTNCNTNCNTVRHTSTHCNTLCNTLQHAASHHTATRNNTLQHTAIHTVTHYNTI